MPPRAPRPFLGVAALVASAIAPGWLLLAVIVGGLEAAGWIPSLVLFPPLNLVFFALFVGAVLGGIFAMRTAGTNRTLGWIALVVAALQLLASFAYLLWSLTDVMNG